MYVRLGMACLAGVLPLTVITAPVPPDEERRVPADQIYSLYRREGFKQFPEWGDKPAGRFMKEICKDGNHSGASNAFVVRGDGIAEAVESAHSILVCGGGADVVSADHKSNSFWLVAFFGHANIVPEEWAVQSVVVKGRVIRLSYKTLDPDREHEALFLRWSYWYWAPLPPLTPGEYAVELYDSRVQSVRFYRRIVIEKK